MQTTACRRLSQHLAQYQQGLAAAYEGSDDERKKGELGEPRSSHECASPPHRHLRPLLDAFLRHEEAAAWTMPEASHLRTSAAVGRWVLLLRSRPNHLFERRHED
jgi:hypothetical protein